MSERREDWRRRLRAAMAAWLGTIVIRLLGMTWRIRREQSAPFDDLQARGEPFVIIFWHGEILPIAWVHRHRGIATLISRHADGEVIARITERLGYVTVRGSSSRGGARALLEMLQVLREGRPVGVTPDGPRGPRHSFAPGAVVLAQRAGCRVVAMRASASRSWRARSWDRHLIPKPFATVTVRYSAPEFVHAATARDAESEVPRFAGILAATGRPNEGA